jgi:eukaryotic-like serine/threonine-protein kinase
MVPMFYRLAANRATARLQPGLLVLEYTEIKVMPEFGRYEVVEEIGRGAMGAVYKANDPVMDRVVAIKTILATALAGPQAEEYRERFKREAKAAGRLSHPGVVTVYDVGVQDDTPYLVMEFVPSRTLESAIDSGERFSIERTMELGQQLASALGYAHKNGVVHRDIKPANVLLTAETPERAKITDFGVAKLSAAQATSTGALLGTPAFMAPEQFTGMGVDGRSDLFSLGVVLYWMATGDKPFSGDTITAVSYKIVHTEPIPPRTLNRAISPAFESVLMKCLEKDPAERYQSGDELGQDLANLREGRTTASQISAMKTVVTAPPPVEPQAIDPQATIPLPKKTAPGTPAAAIPPAPGPADTRGTMALSSTGKLSHSAPSTGAAAAPPEARAAMKSAGAAPKATAPPRPAPPAPPPRVSPRLQPQPEPRISGSRGWIIAAAVLLVLGLLWGASVVKKNRDEAAAALAEQQRIAQAKANEEAHETKKQEVAEQREEKKEAAKEKAAIETPNKPKVEKARVEPREEPQPDVSMYALRLEISAEAPTTVEIQPDDRPAASRLLQVGRKILVGADKVFLLRTDNAGALKLKMNDQELAALGPLGAPRTVRLTARDLKAASGSEGATGGTAQLPPENAAAKAAAAAKIIGKRPGAATVIIDAPNLPNYADIIVWVDDKPVFQRKATRVRGPSPVREQRFVTPGTHEFRIYLGTLAVKTGVQRKISGDFTAGEAKTLHVEPRYRGMPHDVTQLGIILSLQ